MAENDSSALSSICCESMRAQLEAVCATHSSAADCPDRLVGRFGVKGTYGLYVHDGGSSYVGINYCPWCGERLSGGRIKDRKEPLQ
jgi:nitrite reductase/ring-hydroxylating ferredoxin subunit